MERNELFIILASASPRRSMLLAREGYRFRVEPSHVDELDAQHQDVHEIVVENARRKGRMVRGQILDAIQQEGIHQVLLPASRYFVLAADTLVVRGETVYSKPRDLEEAERFLIELGGVSHQVLTGVWLGEITSDGRLGRSHEFLETTTVRLCKMGVEEIRALFVRVTPLDKAAGYGFQDAPEIVEFLQGSITNVYGLPMERLAQELAQLTG